MTAATVREALEVAEHFSLTRTSAFGLSSYVEGDTAALVLEERAELGELREFAVITLLVGIGQIARDATGSELRGVAECAFPAPDYAVRVLGRAGRPRASMVFDRPSHRLVFPASILDLPIVTADPVATQLARAQCDRELAALTEGGGFVGRVRALVARRDEGTRSLEEVAHRLHLSARTLKRRLAEQGTSFSAVLEGVRHQRALLLLENRQLGPGRRRDPAGLLRRRELHPRVSQVDRADPVRAPDAVNPGLRAFPGPPFPVTLRDVPIAAAPWLPRVAVVLFAAAASALAWREGGGADARRPPPGPDAVAGVDAGATSAGRGAPAFEVKRRLMDALADASLDTPNLTAAQPFMQRYWRRMRAPWTQLDGTAATLAQTLSIRTNHEAETQLSVAVPGGDSWVPQARVWNMNEGSFDQRECIFAPTPATIAFRIDVPPAARLRLSPAVLTEPPGDDGVRRERRRRLRKRGDRLVHAHRRGGCARVGRRRRGSRAVGGDSGSYSACGPRRSSRLPERGSGHRPG